MKKQCIIFAFGAMMMASCADQFDQNFEVGRPDNLEQYGYLSEYKALKEYVDYSKYPNFKLGIGVDAADYSKQGVSYVVANTNFSEVVAGNAMKMASCVDDKGNMSFATVEDFAQTATSAGMNVYGHTLAWHEQQPVKWLNTRIAPYPDPNYTAEPVVTKITEKRRCIRVNSDDLADAAWDTQFWLVFTDHPIHTGDTYEFSIDLMANKAATAGSQTHKDPGAYIHWAAVGTLPFTEEWTTFKSSGTFDNDAQEGGYSIAFNLNDFAEANIYYFDNISLKINGVEVIVNGDCEGTETVSFATKEKRGATVPSTIVDETEVYRLETPAATVEVDVPRNCIQVKADDLVEAAWDTQFWLYFPDHVIHTGDSYEVKMNVLATNKATSGTQTHKDPGAYIHWAAIGTIPFETEWTEYKASGTFDNSAQEGGYSIAFNLNDFAGANTYYFDDISLKINGVEVIANGDCEDPAGTANFRTKEARGAIVPSRIVDHYTIMKEVQPTIEQTPEEKKDTLTKAMDMWVKGMMDACRNDNGDLLVTAWDVINEPIGGIDADGDGILDLQHGDGTAEDKFYWQDYLGDEDYARIVVKLARQYGGNDLKLFVNDYNLEYDWDASGHKKLESLIKWIERWEADGQTKIDGIGTQMHISCYMNQAEQEKRKTLIEESFKKLAATGKLIRVSELDMGMVDENGKDVITAEMTEEQHHAMADLYKFVIEKYLEIIPAAQQWGICQWAATDSPAGSGWRPNSPIGLWDENYNRKHTYAGFADGLQGK